MTARHETGVPFESAEAIFDDDQQSEKLPLPELATRLKDISQSLETYAYQAAGQTSADVVADLIIMAAELDRLARRLEK